MNTLLAGQHALVTGANRGIGAAIARMLAAHGAAVTLLVRDREAGDRVARELATPGHVVVADVTDRVALRRACAEAAEDRGDVSILVNNAGSVETVPFLKATPELFERMFAVHVLGAMITAQATLPGMLARGGGRIVNVASIAGLHGAPYVAHYVAAKHGLVGLTRALAVEFGAKGITVNAVCPGYVETDLVDDSVRRIAERTGRSADDAMRTILADAGQPRLVTVDEVARAVLAFCRPDAASRNGETAIQLGLDAP